MQRLLGRFRTPMRGRPGGLAAVVAAALLSLPATALRAQEAARTAVVVDYVGAEGLYLAAGTRHGVQVGDTLTFWADDESLQELGRAVVETATSRRSVATVIGPEFAVAAGDVLFTVLRVVEARAQEPEVSRPAVPAAARPRAGPAAAAPSPRVNGHFSLDLDVRETRTSWGEAGSAPGNATRRFGTPTSRLNLRITDLPGGWRIAANARGSYRYSDGGVPSTTSVRLYDLSATKIFTGAPVELRLGRFYNPFESFGTYFDGAMVRVGRASGLGVGAAAGFEPNRFNEGLSSDVPKVTGFLDYSVRRPDWRYRSDLSLHLIRPQAGDLLDRTFAGWSQRLTVKRVSLDQRLQMDRNPETGSWQLTRLRLRASLGLNERVSLHTGVVRRRSSFLRPGDLLSDSQRDEGSVGLSVFGDEGSIGVDVASTGWAGEERGVAVSASIVQQVGELQFQGSGRRWSRGVNSSLSLAPGVAFDWHSLRARVGYQFYATQGLASLNSHAGDLSLSTSLFDGWRVTARLRQQWGSTFRGTYLRTSFSRGF